MDTRDLLKTFKQQPFEPVRMYLSDGSHYDIRHPDQIIIADRASYIGIGGNGHRAFQDVAKVANIHVTRIEPIKNRRGRSK
jgi:hypothetical protein